MSINTFRCGFPVISEIKRGRESPQDGRVYGAFRPRERGQSKRDERDPEKVATFEGDHPANARSYKAHSWLETARERGGDVSGINRRSHRRQRATRG